MVQQPSSDLMFPHKTLVTTFKACWALLHSCRRPALVASASGLVSKARMSWQLPHGSRYPVQLLASVCILFSSAVSILGTLASPPALQQIQNWEAGKQTIFCATGIGTFLTPTENETKSLQAICTPTGPDNISNSALDAFLAKRFAGQYSYQPAADPSSAKQQSNPFSTESNVPWMLADYVISQSQTMAKADSWKRVVAEAQVDVMFCSDPACRVLVDLQMISSKPEETAVRAAAYSGAKDILQLGLATVNMSMSSSVLDKQDWVPADLSDTRITEVGWLVPDAAILDANRPNVVPFDQVVLIDASHLHSMRIGHYVAEKVLGGRLKFEDNCIILLWPSHEWMEHHEWGYSHAACANESLVIDYLSPVPVYFFDSYFPQARILSDPSELQMNGDDITSDGTVAGVNIANLEDEFITTVNITNTTTNLINKLRAPVQPADLQDREALQRYSGIAGRFSITLPSAAGRSHMSTQMADGCIKACDVTDDGSQTEVCLGRCAVLSIGSETIAADPLESSKMYQGLFVEKLRQYATMSEPLPWCNVSLTDTPSYSDVSGFINVVAFGTSLEPPTHVEYVLRGLLQNCTFWDLLKVGYAHGGALAMELHNDTSKEQLPAPSFADISTQFYQRFYRRGLRLSHAFEDADTVQGFGHLRADLLETSIQSLVKHVALLVDSHLTEELATADLTKTLAGALLDVTVTLVAMVAIASGCGDIQNWLHALLQRCGEVRARWLARVMTCFVVCLSLIVAPIVILAGESAARTNNPSGATSKVGTVAKDTGSGDGPYVVVGIVTIKMTAEYDNAAFNLECFNLALACLAAVLICADLLWPGNPWRVRRQLVRQMAFRGQQPQDAPEIELVANSVNSI